MFTKSENSTHFVLQYPLYIAFSALRNALCNCAYFLLLFHDAVKFFGKCIFCESYCSHCMKLRVYDVMIGRFNPILLQGMTKERKVIKLYQNVGDIIFEWPLRRGQNTAYYITNVVTFKSTFSIIQSHLLLDLYTCNAVCKLKFCEGSYGLWHMFKAFHLQKIVTNRYLMHQLYQLIAKTC